MLAVIAMNTGLTLDQVKAEQQHRLAASGATAAVSPDESPVVGGEPALIVDSRFFSAADYVR